MKQPPHPALAFVLLVVAMVTVGLAFGFSSWRKQHVAPPSPEVPFRADSFKTSSDREPLPALEKEGLTEKEQVPVLRTSFAPSMAEDAKIQVAVLLDVSNSMDGLIEQAKSQLWNMVNVLGKARCAGVQPAFELALYEFGRPANGAPAGYIKQLHAFTTDLDVVSATLFGIKTNGGAEYCPQVIYNTVEQLAWDKKETTYKVIFIAGNESFRQGDLPWSKACEAAQQKGIIVNTIYCGDRNAGISEYWNLGAECGNGSYTNINQDAVIEDMPTPYDSVLFVLNQKLNKTYLAYGARANEAAALQESVDNSNYKMSASVAAKRIEAKGNAAIYRNDSWDMVDASDGDAAFFSKLDKTTLPDSLRGKTEKELKGIVQAKKAERSAIQTEIGATSKKRSEWLTTEKAKQGSTGQALTLETEVEKIIREQAKRFNMIIK